MKTIGSYIDQLQAENARLREALKKIASGQVHDAMTHWHQRPFHAAQNIAQAALKDKEGKDG